MNCNKCGAENPDSYKFCPQCGNPLRVDQAEAERRSLTVMFCDLSGSTALSERLDPEDLQNLVKAYQHCCAQAISRFGGYIARYMGDGILVYFGYPEAHDNDASRAVQSALEISKTVPEIETPAGDALEVRIGIATGDVVVGDMIGEGAAEESAVLGLTPNLAARLQSVAGANSVIVSDATCQRLGDQFIIRDCGTLTLKDISHPVQAWQVTALADDDRFSASRIKPATPFVGREHSLERLQARYQDAAHGRLQIVHIFGQAGGGKTRLLDEFVNSHSDINALVWRCSAFHQHSPLYPLSDDILDGGNENSDSGAQQRQSWLERICQRIGEKTGEGTLVLMVDDGQWLDPTTFDLLKTMRRRLQSFPVLMIIASRPGDMSEKCADQLGGARIDLQPLSDDETVTLTRALIGASVDDEIVNRIQNRSGGLPLFVEELAANVKNNRTADIPVSLQETLLARLDGLGPEKRLVQLASVIGQEFSVKDLRRIIETKTIPLETRLSRLVSEGFLSHRGPVYFFRHALMQEVAYETLLKSTRRRIHGQLADSMMKDDANDVMAQTVARHLTGAGRSLEARPYWLKAAHTLARLWSHAEAAHCLETALSGFAGDDDKTELTTRLDLVESLRILERPEQALAELDKAENLIKTAGDDHDRLRLHVLRGNILFPMGDADGCIKSQMAASEVARRLGDPAAEAKALSGLADAHFVIGTMNAAEAAYGRAVTIAMENDEPDIVMANLSLRGHMRYYQCRMDDAETDCRDAVARAITAGNRRAEMTARGSCLGKVLLDQGSFAAVRREYEASHKIARDLGAHRYEALNLSFQANALLATGCPEDALPLAREARKIAATAGEKFCLPMVLAVLARAVDDGDLSTSLMDNGESIIQDGALAHNALWFYRDAGLAAIQYGWPDRATTFAHNLRTYFADDPLPWVDLIAGGLTALATGLESGDMAPVDAAIRDAENSGFHGWAVVLENSAA